MFYLVFQFSYIQTMKTHTTRPTFAFISILFLLVSFVSISQAFGQTPAEKEKAIRGLLDLSGVRSALKPAMQNMISIMKQQATDAQVPDEFWEEFTSDKNIDRFMELYIPIYDKHYTYQEILDISAFYRTPSGKSMIQKMPAVMAESMQVGSQLGQQIGQEIAEKMAEY